VKKPKLDDDRFPAALIEMFPALGTQTPGDYKIAREFWRTYRNGLLHQATLKTEDRILEVAVHNNAATISVRSFSEGRRFLLSPKKFSKEVIEKIESDFATYQGEGSSLYSPIKKDKSTGRSGYQANRALMSTPEPRPK